MSNAIGGCGCLLIIVMFFAALFTGVGLGGSVLLAIIGVLILGYLLSLIS